MLSADYRHPQRSDGSGFGYFVDHEPVHAHLTDCLIELFEIDRFLDVAVHAQFVAVDQISLLTRGCEHDNRNRTGPLIAANGLKHFEAAELGELEIEKNQAGSKEVLAGLRTAAKKEVQRLGTVPRNMDGIRQRCLLEGKKRQFNVGRVVFDIENLDCLAKHDLPPGLGRFKCEEKRSAVIYLALRPDTPAMFVYDSPNRCQSYACSLELFGAMEPLENAEQLIRVGLLKPGAVIAHIDNRFVPFDELSHFDRGGFLSTSVLHGVRQQVREHDLHQTRIAFQRRE